MQLFNGVLSLHTTPGLLTGQNSTQRKSPEDRFDRFWGFPVFDKSFMGLLKEGAQVFEYRFVR